MLPSPFGVSCQMPSASRSGTGAGAAAGGAACGAEMARHDVYGVRRVDPRLCDGDIEHREPRLAHHDVHRHADAVDIAVVGVGAVDRRVAGEDVVDDGFDALDEMLVVERAGDGKLPERGERHRWVACAARWRETNTTAAVAATILFMRFPYWVATWVAMCPRAIGYDPGFGR